MVPRGQVTLVVWQMFLTGAAEGCLSTKKTRLITVPCKESTNDLVTSFRVLDLLHGIIDELCYKLKLFVFFNIKVTA